MIRIARPFGAILSMFPALRVMSRFRGNDGHEARVGLVAAIVERRQAP